jgi:hypothetical protein
MNTCMDTIQSCTFYEIQKVKSTHTSILLWDDALSCLTHLLFRVSCHCELLFLFNKVIWDLGMMKMMM